jgi:hypothetical protein
VLDALAAQKIPLIAYNFPDLDTAIWPSTVGLRYYPAPMHMVMEMKS